MEVLDDLLVDSEPDFLISHKQHYNLVTYFGDYQVDALIALGYQIVDLCDQSNQSRVFVDLTHSQGKLSLMDRYTLVERMAKEWPKSLKLCVLVNPSQTLKMAGFIWQRLAASRGFNVSLDFSYESAESWLLR